MDEAMRRRMQTLAKVQGLPPGTEIWEATSRLAHSWISDPGEPLRRPYIVLVITADGESVLRVHVVERAPDAHEMFTDLLHAIVRPGKGAGPARRPATIRLDDAALVEAMAPWLADLGVRCVYAAALPALDEAIVELESHLNGGRPLHPGLLSIPGVGVPLAAHLYELAADYYRLAPWTWLDDGQPMAIRCPAATPPRWAVVVGSMRTMLGLAVYNERAHLEATLRDSGDGPRPALAPLVFFFAEVLAASFDDLEAIERYGWALADPKAYPIFTATTPDGQLIPPTLDDLLWMEGALGAIIYYLRRYGRGKRRRATPVDTIVPVATPDGILPIGLRLPAPLNIAGAPTSTLD